MNLKEALKRIEALEARVKELEGRAPIQQHTHYHAAPTPTYQPQPYWIPGLTPAPLPNTVWCAGDFPGSFSS